MRIYVNNNPVDFDKPAVHLTDVIAKLDIPQQGTAIAVNNKLVRREQWEVTMLSEGDRLTIISAAYGG